MMARNLMRGSAGGISILSPAHPNRIATWTMDNVSGSTVIDDTGSHDLTNNGGSTFPAGQVGNAVLGADGTAWLEGTSGATDFQLTVGAVSYFIKPDANGGYAFTLARSAVTNRNTNVGAFSFNSAMRARYSTATLSGNRNFFSDTALTVGVWSHVVFQSDGVTLTCFIDGVASGVTDSSAQSNLGWWFDTGMQGSVDIYGVNAILDSTPTKLAVPVDELGVFDRILTTAEAVTLAAQV